MTEIIGPGMAGVVFDREAHTAQQEAYEQRYSYLEHNEETRSYREKRRQPGNSHARRKDRHNNEE